MTIIEELEPKVTMKMEKKYRDKFEKQARYLGNNIYSIPATDLYSADPRELFLMFVAVHENISFTNK
jgi:hypothetical protein